MSTVQELYDREAYPPMSHPASDPALTAVSARMSGIAVPHPRQARILDIGCSSGHHLLALAQRWPESQFIGIDLTENAIALANQRAQQAGLTNVTFRTADLLSFRPEGGPFDYIIAHGIFSWVPDEVKAALLIFCREHLSPSGVATISFNLENGWRDKLPIIDKVRAIQSAKGCNEVEGLELLKMVTIPDSPEIEIIGKMIAKGLQILRFDDFGPVNDPWPLDRFVAAAERVGLRWLGESDPNENLPEHASLEAIERATAQATDALSFQTALDEETEQTFRSVLLCRADAPAAEKITTDIALDFSVQAKKEPASPRAKILHQAIQAFAPSNAPVKKLLESMPSQDPRVMILELFQGIRDAWVQPRIEEVQALPQPPNAPKLNAFRLLCAQQRLPLVDAWHIPCAFPAAHYEILAAMDGGKQVHELANLAKSKCPELAFKPWLQHLAERGMFS